MGCRKIVLYWSLINVRYLKLSKKKDCCRKIFDISELFRCFFNLFSMFFFYVLSFYIMSFLYFCFSMFCRSMFRHRSAKTKALISFAVTAKLICVFVFAYAKCWVSHDAAQHYVNISVPIKPLK